MSDASGFPQLAGGSVVTVGTFDGVHLGHRDILRHLHERADATGLAPVLVTFRPHPLVVVNPTAAPMLLSPDDEQLEALADSGPLLVAVLPFTPALARFSAAAFVEHLLLERYNMRELVIGYDHGLGRGREGDAATLTALGRRRGLSVSTWWPRRWMGVGRQFRPAPFEHRLHTALSNRQSGSSAARTACMGPSFPASSAGVRSAIRR
jgi:riboflavin kinase/FMN adenylyltransferase